MIMAGLALGSDLALIGAAFNLDRALSGELPPP
jgi:hypothetical protein